MAGWLTGWLAGWLEHDASLNQTSRPRPARTRSGTYAIVCHLVVGV